MQVICLPRRKRSCMPNSKELIVRINNFWLLWRLWKFSKTLFRLLRHFCFAPIRLYPSSGKVLHHSNMSVIASRQIAFIEKWVICCQQVTKIVCTKCCMNLGVCVCKHFCIRDYLNSSYHSGRSRNRFLIAWLLPFLFLLFWFSEDGFPMSCWTRKGTRWVLRGRCGKRTCARAWWQSWENNRIDIFSIAQNFLNLCAVTKNSQGRERSLLLPHFLVSELTSANFDFGHFFDFRKERNLRRSGGGVPQVRRRAVQRRAVEKKAEKKKKRKRRKEKHKFKKEKKTEEKTKVKKRKAKKKKRNTISEKKKKKKNEKKKKEKVFQKKKTILNLSVSSSSACPQTDTAQLYNTHPDSCTHMDRTGLEFHHVVAKIAILTTFMVAEPVRWDCRSILDVRSTTLRYCERLWPPELWMQSCSRTWEAWASRRRSMETMQSTKTFDSASKYNWASSVLFLTMWWTDAILSEIRSPWQLWERCAMHTWSAACRCIMRWPW